jgi:hypothetical protein
LPPSCHHATPRSVNRKRGIHEPNAGSINAGSMDSIV